LGDINFEEYKDPMQRPVEFRAEIVGHKGEIYVGEWLIGKTIR
jgi:hypothetical protein